MVLVGEPCQSVLEYVHVFNSTYYLRSEFRVYCPEDLVSECSDIEILVYVYEVFWSIIVFLYCSLLFAWIS
jgi:hypothetical protein